MPTRTYTNTHTHMHTRMIYIKGTDVIFVPRQVRDHGLGSISRARYTFSKVCARIYLQQPNAVKVAL